MIKIPIPQYGCKVVDLVTGFMQQEWYLFLQNLQRLVDTSDQTYHDVTANRVLGITYKNTTPRKLTVHVSMTNGTNNAIVQYTVGLIALSGLSVATASGTYYPCVFEVPPGATYSCTMNGTPTLVSWHELY